MLCFKVSTKATLQTQRGVCFARNYRLGTVTGMLYYHEMAIYRQFAYTQISPLHYTRKMTVFRYVSSDFHPHSCLSNCTYSIALLCFDQRKENYSTKFRLLLDLSCPRHSSHTVVRKLFLHWWNAARHVIV